MLDKPQYWGPSNSPRGYTAGGNWIIPKMLKIIHLVYGRSDPPGRSFTARKKWDPERLRREELHGKFVLLSCAQPIWRTPVVLLRVCMRRAPKKIPVNNRTVREMRACTGWIIGVNPPRAAGARIFFLLFLCSGPQYTPPGRVPARIRARAASACESCKILARTLYFPFLGGSRFAHFHARGPFLGSFSDDPRYSKCRRRTKVHGFRSKS